eukprot:1140434-Pelagomonas_calceolata.AAC.2
MMRSSTLAAPVAAAVAVPCYYFSGVRLQALRPGLPLGPGRGPWGWPQQRGTATMRTCEA